MSIGNWQSTVDNVLLMPINHYTFAALFLSATLRTLLLPHLGQLRS
jgi:hypothetical protein